MLTCSGKSRECHAVESVQGEAGQIKPGVQKHLHPTTLLIDLKSSGHDTDLILDS